MKFHGSRYAVTAGLGAFSTGLACLQFGFSGLILSAVVGVLCLIVIPYEMQGDK